MNLWRLEWLRILRTKRWIALFGVYVFFGFIGPLTARYLNDLLARSAELQGGAQIDLPPPTPADGIAQFISNASQLGILVVAIVAAGAFVMKPEVAVFFRSRVQSTVRLLVPRYVMAVAVSSVAFIVGAAAAWYETVVLLGDLPVDAMLIGIGFEILALAFVVAVVAAVSSRAKTMLATVLISLVALVLLPLIGLIRGVNDWLPTRLIAAMNDLLREATAGDFTKAVVVTVVATVGLLWLAVWGHQTREI